MDERRWPVREMIAKGRFTRRAVLRSTALGAAALASPRLARVAAAKATQKDAAYVPRPNAAQYVIGVGAASINPDGAQPVPAVLANGSLPGPEIRVREGDMLRILVENQLTDSPTSIHWHGVLLPAAMDGVPDISNAPIAAGQTYVYEYPIRQTGTYWYHSHFGFQEQQGCYGAFIIEPAQPARVTERDAVILLGDWLHRSPEEVYTELRGASASAPGKQMGGGQPGAMQMGGAKPAEMKMGEGKPGAMQMGDATPAPMQMGGGKPEAMKMDGAQPGAMKVGESKPDATPMGEGKPGAMKMGESTPGGAPGAMNMAGGGADLSDVKYDAFLLNGRGPNEPWTMMVRPGERVRLRLINGGSSTYFRLRLDGHQLQVTHADGLAVQPVTVDHLLIGMGEIYDAVVQIAGRGSYTLHAVAQDGSGQALGVLHTADATPQPNRAMPSFDGRDLAYTDLRATAPTTLPDGPVRSFRLPLQGDMARYIWMIDGQVWPKADPLRIRRGERVQIEMTNETMMWHPMHLHGHFFRLLQGAGDYCPLKHTANVAPRETVRIEFIADNPGNWFFHCHNAYHLEAGMARKFEYMA